MKRPGEALVPGVVLILVSCAPAAGVQERVEGFARSPDGIELYYESTGEGPETIVFIHGTPSTMYSLAKDFDELACDFRLVFYDQRGGGRSTMVLDRDSLTWQAHVADLEALRTSLNLERMHLFGLSWGSFLAAQYAAMYPDRVDRMIVLPMRARRNPDIPESDAAPRLMLDSLGRAEAEELFASWSTAPDPVSVCERYWQLHVPLMFFDVDAAGRMKGGFCEEPPEVLRYSWEVSSARMGSMGDFDLRPLLAGISSPVLVMKGKHTSMYHAWTEEWSDALPNADLIWVESAGLLPWIEKPDVVFPAMRSFLRGQGPS
jgi:proline iminopeptidase